MAIRQFSKDVKVVPILSYASGTADRVASVIDMLGYDAVFIAVHHAAIGASATYKVFLQHADAASDATTLTNGADVAGTEQTIAHTDDNKLTWLEVINPTKRFYQLNVDNDTTNTTAQSAVAYLYRTRDSGPVTHATGSGTSGGSAAVLTGEVTINPSSGTK